MGGHQGKYGKESHTNPIGHYIQHWRRKNYSKDDHSTGKPTKRPKQIKLPQHTSEMRTSLIPPVECLAIDSTCTSIDGNDILNDGINGRTNRTAARQRRDAEEGTKAEERKNDKDEKLRRYQKE